MIRRIKFITGVLCTAGMVFAAGTAFAGGVDSISQTDSFNGKARYWVTCSNGKKYRLFWDDSKHAWIDDASAIPARAGDNPDLKANAGRLCN